MSGYTRTSVERAAEAVELIAQAIQVPSRDVHLLFEWHRFQSHTYLQVWPGGWFISLNLNTSETPERAIRYIQVFR